MHKLAASFCRPSWLKQTTTHSTCHYAPFLPQFLPLTDLSQGYNPRISNRNDRNSLAVRAGTRKQNSHVASCQRPCGSRRSLLMAAMRLASLSTCAGSLAARTSSNSESITGWLAKLRFYGRFQASRSGPPPEGRLSPGYRCRGRRRRFGCSSRPG